MHRHLNRYESISRIRRSHDQELDAPLIGDGSSDECEPVNLESELADNGYDRWLDMVFEHKGIFRDPDTLEKYIVPPTGTESLGGVKEK